MPLYNAVMSLLVFPYRMFRGWLSAFTALRIALSFGGRTSWALLLVGCISGVTTTLWIQRMTQIFQESAMGAILWGIVLIGQTHLILPLLFFMIAVPFVEPNLAVVKYVIWPGPPEKVPGTEEISDVIQS